MMNSKYIRCGLTAGTALALFVSIQTLSPIDASAKDTPQQPRLASPSPAPASTEFEICFRVPHGRCFVATRNSSQTTGSQVLLLQKTDSAQFSNALDAKRLERFRSSITSLLKNTSYAKPSKSWNCTKPLELIVEDRSETRCLELLRKKENNQLSVLVNQLSLASKK
jgi:hypothetical protein